MKEYSPSRNQYSCRKEDNQSHISIALQVEFVTMSGRTMLQPVTNMVRYDGSLVSDVSPNPAAALDFFANLYNHMNFNSYLFLCFTLLLLY